MTAGPRLLPLSPLGIIDTALLLYRRHARSYLSRMMLAVSVLLVALLWVSGDLAGFLFGQRYWPFGLIHPAQIIYASGGALRADDLPLVLQQLVTFCVVQSLIASVLLPVIARDYVGGLRWPEPRGVSVMLWVAPGILALLPAGMLSSLLALVLTMVNLWLAVLVQPEGATLLVPLALDTLQPLLVMLALLVLLARFVVMPQLLLLEGLGLRAALARCLRLTSGAYGRIVLTMLLFCLLSGLVAGLPLLLPDLTLLIPLDAWSGWLPWIGLLLSNIFQTLLAPLPLLVTTVLYVDLRVRTEGLDLLNEAGRSEQEREDLLRLNEILPNQAWTFFHIAMTYASQNRVDDAFKWQGGALALDIRYARDAAGEEAFTALRADPRFRALILREGGGQPASTQESIHDEQR